MSRWRDRLDLTIAGEHAVALQRLAHERDGDLLNLMNRLVTLLLEYDRMSRNGYHLGMAKDPTTLEVQVTGLWK